MRQIRKSGSMSEVWKRSRAEIVRHPQTKERATANANFGLNHRATPRLYYKKMGHHWPREV